MTIEEVKYELTKRYKFLYQNASFILAPYMHEETKEEIEKTLEQRKKIGLKDLNEPLIYFIQPDKKTLDMLEELLLSTTPLEKTEFYNLHNQRLTDANYIREYKKGIKLVEKHNKVLSLAQLKIKLNLWKLLACVRNNIKNQSSDIKNRDKKLKCLDEYFRINRYTNDGKIWHSGFHLFNKDIEKNYEDYSYSSVMFKNKFKPNRDLNDTGVKNNKFINILSDNQPFLTENEKQKIYLEYHDELPWDLEIECNIEEEYIPTMIETRLIRPENTEPCNKNFYIKENEIFIRPNDRLYKYYQLCPHCGFIVNIPKEILSDTIKNRINERCSKDDNLFRKMYLYSELKKLDDISKDEQKKLLKK